MNYGYARVSSRDQNIDRQLRALENNGVRKKNIYVDYVSGKDFNRPAYQKLVKKLKPRDLLIVSSIDRLGRNYRDILEEWHVLTKVKQVDIQVLDLPLLNTRVQNRGLTGQFIADLVLQILSYVSQIERENIRQRQREGIDSARKRGVRFGRPKIPKPPNYQSVKEQWKKSQLSTSEAADLLGISTSTFSRWVRAE
ncbi:recombinase family protein [Streptococcus sp. NLN76]|uniref:recombinase family protein n=1 Tax=Streptococcus sp. NLN76 TaxID=2822800 RepID=UPI0018A963E6|nr:recombinase family protein [Streptococcus sp. NLN76]MBF8970000.1 recombinase family protein [Streptococcus sp. NLN76]